jgi:hypothetical protein
MPTKPTPTKPHSDPVAEAQAIIERLQAQREKLARRQGEHEVERQRLAYRARVEADPEASRRLSDMADEAVRNRHQLRDIDAALVTARERFAAAERVEAQKADRQKAKEMRKLVGEVGECFPYLGHHLEEAARALIAINDGSAKLHAAGFAFPSDQQLRLGIAAIIQTWAHSLPRSWHQELRDGLRFLAPHERKTAVSYWAQIEASIDRQITERLGEAERTDEEAA